MTDDADALAAPPASFTGQQPQSRRRRAYLSALSYLETRETALRVLRNVAATKSPEEIMASVSSTNHAVHKVLSWWHLFFIGCGTMIGAGLFVLSGIVAREKAGPGVVVSFMIAGLAAILAALCYAEFAARLPAGGSAYVYAYTSVGELVAFILSFQLILEYAVAAGAVARGFSAYLTQLLDDQLPSWMTQIPLNSIVAVDVVACLLVLTLTLLLIVGVKESTWFNNLATGFNVLIIIFIIIIGATLVDTKNYTPFLPFGFPGVVSGAATVFFSYIGFDAASTMAESVKNPSRDLPLGILSSCLVTTGLYCAVGIVLVGMVPYYEIDSEAPLAVAFVQRGVGYGRFVVAAGALAGLVTTVFCSLMGQPWIFMSLSRDGLLFEWFGKMHPRFKTPANATLFTGCFAMLLALFIRIEVLADLVSIGTLFAFTIVALSTVILRYKEPSRPARTILPAIGCLLCSTIVTTCIVYDQWIVAGVFFLPLFFCGFLIWRLPSVNVPKTFGCPWMPVLPLLSVFLNIYLMVSLELATWIRFVVWTVFGLCIYAFYGYSHSKLRKRREGLAALGGELTSVSNSNNDVDDDDNNSNNSSNNNNYGSDNGSMVVPDEDEEEESGQGLRKAALAPADAPRNGHHVRFANSGV